MRKIFTPQQKAQIALAAIKNENTITQIASTYEVHPTQVGLWKKTAQEGLPQLFTDKRKKENADQERIIDELYKAIGQRDMELAWLKKKLQPYIPSG